MAKSLKKTIGKKIVGAAVIGMPKPVKKAAGTKWGTRLVLFATPILFAAGVLTVDWTGWWPKLGVDQERAQEVKDKIAEELGSAKRALQR